MRKTTYSGVKCSFNCPWTEKNVIYMLTFPSGGIYIGQTVQKLRVRMKQHCLDSFQERNYRYDNLKNRAIRKYNQFTVDIIERCSSVDEMNVREDIILSEYREKGFKLYNTASGGLNNCEYFGIKCVVTDKKFNKLKAFSKLKDAREYMESGINNTSTLEHYMPIKKKFFLLSYDDYIRVEPSEHLKRYTLQKDKKKREQQRKRKANLNTSKKHYNIVQIDHRLNVVSIMDVHEAINKYGEIARGCLNTKRYAQGYYWMKEEEYSEMQLNGIPLQSVLKGLRYIYQIDTNMNIIAEFHRVVDASVDTGHGVGAISNNIRAQTCISNEYFFVRSDEYPNITDAYVKRITTLEQTCEPKIVYEHDKDHNLINTYSSINECARAKRVSKRTISARARSKAFFGDTYLTH